MTYSDGCMVTPLDDGSWVMTPVTEHTPVADTAGIDAAWREVKEALNRRGGDWHVVIENHESGDGYSEPHYEAYRAVAELGHAFPAYLQRVQGSIEGDLAAALLALAAALRTPKPEGEPE